MALPTVRRVFAVAAILAAASPALSAGRAACCAPKVEPRQHACCVGKAAMAHAIPKGCCKTPSTPRPAARADDASAPAVAAAPLSLAAPALSEARVTGPTAVLLARRAHRAPSPDDSPPDLLGKTQTLLI